MTVETVTTTAVDAEPVVTELPPTTTELCDGESSGGTAAIYEVLLPSGKTLALCGHHARKFGVSAENHSVYGNEDKKKGSAH